MAETNTDNHYVRLIVNKALDNDEIKEFFDIADEHLQVNALNESDDAYDTQVNVYEDGGIHTYEIDLASQPSEDEAYNVAQELADAIEHDFEIEAK